MKTNVMRLLDRAKIPYESREYAFSEEDLSGVHAADVLGLPYGQVFKTLVLRGDKTGYFYLGELIEYDNTRKIFTNPEKESTQNYITGRFG